MQRRLVVSSIALTVVVIDQLVKAWVLASLADGHIVHVIGDLLTFRYVDNPGAAFSLGTGSTWAFTLLATAVVIGIAWYAPRIGSRAWVIGFAGLMGGAAGNLVDRLLRPPGFGVGHVVDFIATPHFPVFNIADMTIVCSVGLMILLSSRGIPVTGRTHG